MTLKSLAKNLFGSRNQRILKRMGKIVNQINVLEDEVGRLTEKGCKEKTKQFQKRYADGESLDSLLPEAFALVREAAKRTLNMRHFDVQLQGGIALHSNKIAEMHTGEGKTLVATLPAYLNALTCKGVHIVTVNDYLASRDANWMRPVYEYLGLSVGIIVANLSKEERQAAYAADVTYGTNNEFGFDYLRDNMAFSLEEKVMRPVHYAIVDEVDSILIDEARTPLIISGAADDSSALYQKIDKIIPQLERQIQEEGAGDFSVDEKAKQVFLTEQGHETIERVLVEAKLIAPDASLYDASNIIYLHHVNAALRAHYLFQRDVDYIVRDKSVIIVDEHTGRSMPGRRWSDGLHQAIEAKEHVKVHNENQTLASITFQNFFRLYDKLSGMTGTADTEAYEFHQIYGLEVVVIPTNKPNQRQDLPDLIFMSQKEKFAALIADIKECHKRKQPTLVGTASIETSEYLSSLLTKEGIEHQVLNAKFHEKEAHIIAQAGQPGTVTIATNMAGRGTDIVLGGNLEAQIHALNDPTEEQIQAVQTQWQAAHKQVVDAGGLHVIGSERHESRRIDNQLRGRCGRQGDPGSTRFYLSLEDNLMRIFAAPSLVTIMQKLGMEEGQAIESGMVTRAIENAQRKVEGRNFDIRKQLLEFDNVANEQRKIIYEQRNDLMSTASLGDTVIKIREDVLSALIAEYVPPGSLEEQWQVSSLEKRLNSDFNVHLPISKWLKEDNSLYDETLREKIIGHFQDIYQEKEALAGSDVLHQFEKAVLLQNLDHHWKEHLAAMDYLRQSINLRGYAQKDPKQEYKREAFNLFTDMLEHIKYDVISVLSRFEVRAEADVEAIEKQHSESVPHEFEYQHAQMNAFAGEQEKAPEAQAEPAFEKIQPYIRGERKIGRNEPCFCGSGKKYKHCHGHLTQ